MTDVPVRIIQLANRLVSLVFKTSMDGCKGESNSCDYRVKFLHFLLSCLIYI